AVRPPPDVVRRREADRHAPVVVDPVVEPRAVGREPVARRFHVRRDRLAHVFLPLNCRSRSCFYRSLTAPPAPSPLRGEGKGGGPTWDLAWEAPLPWLRPVSC